jgi:hypothetical protein
MMQTDVKDRAKRRGYDWPLAYPVVPHPEEGPTVKRYYEIEHRHGRYGKYWPLHLTSTMTRRGGRHED